jgi:hypothetical protein
VAARRKVSYMKRRIPGRILLLVCVVVVHSHTGATTCIAANKTFKVKEVCGKVTNPLNEPIARAEIELLNTGSDVLSQVLTDPGGNFAIPDVSKGQYKIRVQRAGYSPVEQEFIVTRSKRNARCDKPMQVRLQLGSGCSGVSK